jgi:hypothetical protein
MYIDIFAIVYLFYNITILLNEIFTYLEKF